MQLANNEEDIKLEKISKFLEQGGTMLAQHCECGVPLFRFKGKVICPICDSNSNKDEKKQKEIEILKESTIEQSHPQISIPPVNEIPITSQITPNIHSNASTGIQPDAMSSETSEFIKKTLINKIVQLSLDLQRETDLSRIKQQIEAIESGTKALDNLK
ncbi:MAG: hypothetical protein IBX40_01920 [Methanosarcinales archaeon]|nr:hypothetical protein [Methanosarcinales archaeon]